MGHVTSTGVAMALRCLKSKNIILSCGGEGLTSEPHFHSDMNFSGVYKLPIVFFILNNQYAISIPRTLQTGSQILAIKAIAYGGIGYFIDGNGPVVNFVTTKLTREEAFQDKRPILIETLCYRFDPGCMGLVAKTGLRLKPCVTDLTPFLCRWRQKIQSKGGVGFLVE